MSATKIVKRYANRKLYDTERSCYVTLEDISVMIKAGDEVRVIDNKSGEDLTSVTLAQIIFETEKKNNFMPLSLLRGLIQDGGEAINEFTRDGVGRVSVKAQEVKDAAQKIRSGLESVIRNEEDTGPRMVTDLVTSARKTFEELQKSVVESMKGPVGAVARYANLGREMEEIQLRLAELEQRLEQFPQS